jgi:acyl-CoA reductase-like NAD-dependent aldehyde dehydrogenase
MSVVVNPATQKAIAEVPEATAEDADRAVETAGVPGVARGGDR